MATCKYCGREIIWGQTRPGTWMPLDPTPTPPDGGGQYYFTGNGTEIRKPYHDDDHGRLFEPHIATCDSEERRQEWREQFEQRCRERAESKQAKEVADGA